MSYFDGEAKNSPNTNSLLRNLNSNVKHIPHSQREKIGLHSFYLKDNLTALQGQVDMNNLEKNRIDGNASSNLSASNQLKFYSTVFKNNSGEGLKKNPFHVNPQKDYNYNGLGNGRSIGFGMQSNIIDSSEQKFKTQYGFNMNLKAANMGAYMYRKNVLNKENRSISPKNKEHTSNTSILKSKSQNHTNVMKYTPQQPLQRLPNLIIQDIKPELKKFSTTNSNNFNLNLNNNKKTPIPQAVLQEKIADKNQFFSKLNEMSQVFFNKQKEQKERKSQSPNDTNLMLSNMINSLSKEANAKSSGGSTINNTKLKPLKSRKALSNKEITDNTANNLNLINFNQLAPLLHIEKHNERATIEEGITHFTSQTNVNKLIQVFACRSRAGNQIDGSRKTNQDSYIAKTSYLNMDNFSIFGVYDGHGVNGHFVSQHVVSYLKEYFEDKEIYNNHNLDDLNWIYSKLTENNYELIKKAYLKAECSLFTQKFESGFSGCTAVSTLILGNKILCANAGDSRAIVVECNTSNSGEDGREMRDFKDWRVKELSRDHKPELPDEKERIMANNGRVERYTSMGMSFGPYRVWLKNETFPGLAMSRSIGDFVATTVGVVSEPEIIEYTINSSSRFIVIASDGVWEFLTNEDIMNFVIPYYKTMNATGAGEKLVEESLRAWRYENTSVDDITAVVIFLK